MRIFRGPSTKDLMDETHDEVANKELAAELKPWHEFAIVRANISKDATERQAVVHIEFEAEDIKALHTSFIDGLVARVAECKSMEQEIYQLQVTLSQISFLRDSIAYRDCADIVNEMADLADKALKHEN